MHQCEASYLVYVSTVFLKVKENNATAETDKVKSEGGDMTSKFYRKSKMWTRVGACALHSILLTFMKRAVLLSRGNVN